MRVLLDTNILIHREAATVVRRDIGRLFLWLDRLRSDKCVHPATLDEINKHKDERVRNTFQAKLQSYQVLKTIAPMSAEVQAAASADKSENDRNDTLLINELYAGRVDILITEDRGLHRKALALGIPDRIFTIDAYSQDRYRPNRRVVEHKGLFDGFLLFCRLLLAPQHVPR